MNVPGRGDGNWSWRVTETMLSDAAFQWLRELTDSSQRSAGAGMASANKKVEAAL